MAIENLKLGLIAKDDKCNGYVPHQIGCGGCPYCESSMSDGAYETKAYDEYGRPLLGARGRKVSGDSCPPGERPDEGTIVINEVTLLQALAARKMSEGKEALAQSLEMEALALAEEAAGRLAMGSTVSASFPLSETPLTSLSMDQVPQAA